MRKVLLLVVLLLCLPLATAYYADIVVDVAPTGEVSISGTTNHPTLLVKASQNYTSKDAQYWLLNITKDGFFEAGVVEIMLPKGTDVNYLKAPSFSRFTQANDRLVIVSTLENKPFSFLVQYSITPEETNDSFKVWFVILIATVSIFLSLFLFKKKRATTDFDLSVLPSRQRAIMKILIRHNGRLTQAQLEKSMDLPKSSLSRNVDALVRLGLIEKIPTGMTNVLKLKK